jgi:hypothetical protein
MFLKILNVKFILFLFQQHFIKLIVRIKFSQTILYVHSKNNIKLKMLINDKTHTNELKDFQLKYLC